MRKGFLWLTCLLLAVVGVCVSASPQGEMRVQAAPVGPAAILDVPRAYPGDSDEAWHRQIMTLAAMLTHRGDWYDELLKRDDMRAVLEKNKNFTADDLRRSTVVAVLPDTSLLTVQVRCGEDAAMNAAATNALVDTVLHDLAAQRNAEQTEQINKLDRSLQVLKEAENQKLAAVEGFVRANNLDRPADPLPTWADLQQLYTSIEQAKGNPTEVTRLEQAKRDAEHAPEVAKERAELERRAQTMCADVEAAHELRVEAEKRLLAAKSGLDGDAAPAFVVVERAR